MDNNILGLKRKVVAEISDHLVHALEVIQFLYLFVLLEGNPIFK
jgi:hypothetical protein